MNSVQFVKSLNDLPTLSSVVNQINENEKKMSLTAKSLGEIINTDPALSSKVLRLANSAYYGLAKEVTTIDRAVTVLGFNTIKSLALSASIYKIFKDGKHQPIDMEGLWRHSLGSAVSSKIICRVANPSQDIPEQAFLAGILHDIGIIAFAYKLPEKLALVLKTAKEMHSQQSDIEKDVIGFNHQKIGSMMADLWNFPDQYINAIKWHHIPMPDQLNDKKIDSILANAVFVGNQMAKALKLGASTDPPIEKIPISLWHSLGIKREILQELRQQIEADYALIVESWNIEKE